MDKSKLVRWTDDDESKLEILHDAQKAVGSKVNWTEIGKALGGRSAAACSQHYHALQRKKEEKLARTLASTDFGDNLATLELSFTDIRIDLANKVLKITVNRGQLVGKSLDELREAIDGSPAGEDETAANSVSENGPNLNENQHDSERREASESLESA